MVGEGLQEYQLAKDREREIAKNAEMARLMECNPEPAAAGIARKLFRAVKDAVAPREVGIESIPALGGDVAA